MLELGLQRGGQRHKKWYFCAQGLWGKMAHEFVRESLIVESVELVS